MRGLNKGMSRASRNEVVPAVTAALVCEDVAESHATGFQSLLNVISEVRVLSFPYETTTWAYFQFTDAQGKYEAEFRFINADTGETVIMYTSLELNRLAHTNSSQCLACTGDSMKFSFTLMAHQGGLLYG